MTEPPSTPGPINSAAPVRATEQAAPLRAAEPFARADVRHLDLTPGGPGLSATTTARQVLALQRLAGNAAVGSLLSRSTLARQPQVHAAPERVGTAADAAEYLRDMARFLRIQREHFAELLHPRGRVVTQQERRRALAALNQQRVEGFLRQARSTYEFQLGRLPANAPERVQLRDAYVEALGAIRGSAGTALDLSAGADAATQQAEQGRYAANLASWIEASPMGSAALAGTTAFQQADVAAGGRYEAELEAFLDDLLARLPGLGLGAAQRDQAGRRLDAALRRAFVTVRAGPDGSLDVRAIANAALAAKYRRAFALLQQGIQNRPQMNIITATPPVIQLPDPVPDVTNQLAGAGVGQVDLTHVPPAEVDSVRFGILQAARTIFPPAMNIQLRNAIWPLSLPIRSAAGVVNVRYELTFDAASNVRAERLGSAAPRPVDPAFAQLNVDQKKAQLVAEFDLRAVDDRPAAGNRPAARWSSAELDQVKSAFARIPPGDRDSLRGVTLVRDHRGPGQQQGGQTLAGFAHTAASAQHDQPGPAAHGPPHIHYYDEAFRPNQITAVGAPGDAGPGGDWTLLHEVGHFRIFRALRTANAQTLAANQQLQHAIQAVNAALPGVQWGGHPQWVQARIAWNAARIASNQAVVAFNQAVVSANPAIQAQRAQRLQAARNAAQTRDQRVQDLQAAGVPQGFVQRVTDVGTAIDAMMAASEALVASREQIPIFAQLANRFGFHAFTAYAGTSNDEWFAETYSLFINDPDRLNQLNRRMFQWFEAGMPMDANWNP